jgi:hypothetical protein
MSLDMTKTSCTGRRRAERKWFLFVSLFLFCHSSCAGCILSLISLVNCAYGVCACAFSSAYCLRNMLSDDHHLRNFLLSVNASHVFESDLLSLSYVFNYAWNRWISTVNLQLVSSIVFKFIAVHLHYFRGVCTYACPPRLAPFSLRRLNFFPWGLSYGLLILRGVRVLSLRFWRILSFLTFSLLNEPSVLNILDPL